MRVRTTLRLATKTWCLAAIVMLWGCSGQTEPRVEVWQDGVYQPRVVSTYEISGKRDGAMTKAVATFTLETGERLRLELEVVYNPTPSLGSGRWRIDGSLAGSGEVRPESIRFTGGQAQGPSLGGRFRLEENGNTRFRVVLPMRPIDQRKWTVE